MGGMIGESMILVGMGTGQICSHKLDFPLKLKLRLETDRTWFLVRLIVVVF